MKSVASCRMYQIYLPSTARSWSSSLVLDGVFWVFFFLFKERDEDRKGEKKAPVIRGETGKRFREEDPVEYSHLEKKTLV